MLRFKNWSIKRGSLNSNVTYSSRQNKWQNPEETHTYCGTHLKVVLWIKRFYGVIIRAILEVVLMRWSDCKVLLLSQLWLCAVNCAFLTISIFVSFGTIIFVKRRYCHYFSHYCKMLLLIYLLSCVLVFPRIICALFKI